MSLPIVGQRYLFNGLPGETKFENEERIVKILGCSVVGRISFNISFDGDQPRDIYDVSLIEAQELLKTGIWTAIEE